MTSYVFEGLHVDYKIPTGASDEVYVASRNIEMWIGVPDTEGSLRYEVIPGAGPNELPLISFASSAIYNMKIGGKTVDASWELRLGQIDWDMSKSSQVLTLSPMGTNDLYMIHLGGDALPPFGWHLAADWQAFLDGTVMSEIASGALTPATDFRIYDLPLYDRVNSEVLTGSHRADSLYGGIYDDTLYGRGGRDFLEGGDDSDELYGGGSNDRIFGGDGNDRLEGGQGNDWLFGGGDNDSLSTRKGFDTLYGGDGQDGLSAFSNGHTLFGGKGDDHLIAFTGGNTLHGNKGADSLISRQSGNVLYGGLGNDTLESKGGDDMLYGGGGNDHLSSLYGGGVLYGGAGNDQLKGGERYNNTLFGGDGDDTLIAGERFDTLFGGGGNDAFVFSTKRLKSTNVVTDFTLGEDVIDLVSAKRPYVSLSFDDLLITAVGVDAHITYGRGTVVVLTGVDAAMLSAADFRGLHRSGTDAADILVGTDFGNSLSGLAGDDVLTGGSDKDRIGGDMGDDTLYGGDGRDYLFGGDGMDTLYGGLGNDRLYGGEGGDVFVFDGTLDEGRDDIYFFQDGLDLIRITGAVFADLTLAEVGSDTQITLACGSEILLHGTALADIDASDFDFV